MRGSERNLRVERPGAATPGVPAVAARRRAQGGRECDVRGVRHVRAQLDTAGEGVVREQVVQLVAWLPGIAAHRVDLADVAARHVEIPCAEREPLREQARAE